MIPAFWETFTFQLVGRSNRLRLELMRLEATHSSSFLFDLSEFWFWDWMMKVFSGKIDWFSATLKHFITHISENSLGRVPANQFSKFASMSVANIKWNLKLGNINFFGQSGSFLCRSLIFYGASCVLDYEQFLWFFEFFYDFESVRIWN